MRPVLLLALLGGLGCAEPDDVGPVINEVVSDNRSGHADEAGEADDWIELFNPSDEAVDLAGWTLRDDFREGEVWTLPEGLAVDAGGYALLWLDGTPEQGDAHGPFTLLADGAVLLLLDAEGALVEDVRVGWIETDLSFARVPDGSETWDYLHDPTPGGPND